MESVKHLIALEDREIGHLTGEASKIHKEQRSLGERRNQQEVCVSLIEEEKKKKTQFYPLSVSSEPNLQGRTEATRVQGAEELGAGDPGCLSRGVVTPGGGHLGHHEIRSPRRAEDHGITITTTEPAAA